MAQPAGAENGDLHEEDQAPTAPHVVDFLNNMSTNERAMYFRKNFARDVVPLSSISTPDLCQTLPEFYDDIVDGYFHSTTFTVKVWVNYDTAAQRFFTDARAEDCGKLRLNQKEKTRLEQALAGGMELYRLRLLIGTPFRTLCHITLRTAPTYTGSGRTIVVARSKSYTDRHPELMDFVQGICNELDEHEFREGQHGFTLNNVHHIATWLRRVPHETDFNRYGHFDARGPWMDLSARNGWNYGYFHVPMGGWTPGGQRIE